MKSVEGNVESLELSLQLEKLNPKSGLGAKSAVSSLVRTYWRHLAGIKEGVVGREEGGGYEGG